MIHYGDGLVKEVGESEAFLDFQEKVAKVAIIDRPVLLIGERGTGKELAAKRLHYMSSRWQKPIVTINCAALPPSLIESELFGYEKGAFTGALATRKGRFEEAEGGTLFLDEIGLIPLETQEKLLRVVEYGTYERLGSSQTLETNARIIGATNADLKALCREGKFKEDLLDRLSFEVLFLPPLRKRGDDIMVLSQYFAARMALECGYEDIPTFSDDVVKKLYSYSFPGNVRELKNIIERAVYRSGGAKIEDVDFNPFDNPFADATKAKDKEESTSPILNYDLKDLAKAHEDIDITFISRALDESMGNQRVAADLLGITYDQFRGIYRKYRSRLK